MSCVNPKRNDLVEYHGLWPGLNGYTGRVMISEVKPEHSWDCMIYIRDNRGIEHIIPAHYYELITI